MTETSDRNAGRGSPRAVGTSGRFLTVKNLAATVLCHPLMGRLIGVAWRRRIPFRGHRIETPRGGDPTVNALLLWGMYESAEIRLVRQYVDHSRDVVELGSSLGGVSCELAKLLGGKRTLICVEANGEILETLRRNVLRNAPRPQQRVEFVHGAIDYSGRQVVEIAIGESNLSSTTSASAKGAAAMLSTPAVSLSRMLSDHDIREYTLVADIEGAEAAMLLRDSRALAGCKTLIIELHAVVYSGARYTVDDLARLVTEATGMVPVDRYGDVYVFQRDGGTDRPRSSGGDV